MKLIVTGGLGHIGTGLLDHLSQVKSLKKIIIIDNLTSNKLILYLNLRVESP